MEPGTPEYFSSVASSPYSPYGGHYFYNFNQGTMAGSPLNPTTATAVTTGAGVEVYTLCP